MISEYGVYAILVVYIALMYVIAGWGDGLDLQKRPKLRLWVYGLSLAVYCTSWTFFGAVGTAASKGWDFLPIYLGPLILFTAGWPLVKKVIALSKANNVTSIADFVASLYGKSRRIAVFVTIIAVLAAIPYITLQLEAITASINTISNQASDSHENELYSALLITILLALFSTAFGTRKLDVTEHHRGLMMAIAFESALKLVAFIAVGLFVIFFVYSGPSELVQQGAQISNIAKGPNLSINFMAQSMLALLVFMCLPRQFHVTVVENENRADLGKARIIFITYLVVFTLFVIPIAMAGNEYLVNGSRPDMYVLQLPMLFEKDMLTMLVFLGGLAAATGMVIISTIALSTMVSNDLVLPLYLKYINYHISHKDGLQFVVLWSRRISIFAISFAAFVFYGLVNDNLPLAAMGNLSFLLMVQFAPAMMLGMYWPKSNKQAAFIGMMAGVIAWAWLVLFPGETGSTLAGFVGTMVQLTGPNPPLFKLFVATFLVNVLTHISYALIAGWWSKRNQNKAWIDSHQLATETMTVADLKQIVNKLVGENFAEQSFANFTQDLGGKLKDENHVNTPLIQFTEKILAGSIGSSSARAVITAMLKSKGLAVNEIIDLLDETKQAIQFNRKLIDATLDNISQGVSVVDDNLRLVAWNKQYIDLLEFPEGFIKRGMPIADVLRFNVERGMIQAAHVSQEVEKRMVHLRQRHRYQSERQFKNGKYLKIEGNPMPNGGYVSTYDDVTQYRKAQNDLIESQKQIQFYTDNSPAMLSYLNSDRVFLFANKAYENFIGQPRQQLIGSKLDAVFEPAELEKRRPYLEAAFSGSVQTFEMEIIDFEGEIHFILGTYVPDIKNDQVNGLFVIMQDISTRRKAELELEQTKTNLEIRVMERTQELSIINKELATATEKAEQANLSKTKFIADASHDLLQPFNAARLFSSILTEKTDEMTDEIAGTVHNLDQSLRSAENMLGALLDIAKFDAGGIEIKENVFPLQRLFAHLENQYQPRAAKKGLKLTVRKTKLWVKSDDKLLYRILQNLTSNAIRYTQTGGVLVACRKYQGQVQIVVVDSGVGLNDAEKTVIFKEFKRLNKMPDTDEKGLGLGLSIVERIVSQLGIALSIRSKPGKGSSFIFSVPLAASQTAAAGDGEQQVFRHTSQPLNKTVICIDNEPQILLGMSKLLSGWGLQVYGAEGSEQVIELLQNDIVPDVMLVDYQLNDELGTDVIKQVVKTFDLNCPIVIITANHSEELKTEVEKAGYGLLLKPIKPIKLRQLLNKYF
ncbi:MAG: PAS-domain containing protein [Xanthomonadales bacterium]|nr:PAS-domain containing protein [Xanthomonadales bacterium]